MATSFQKKSDWYQFFWVALTALLLMVLDARTSWLNAPRNALAVAVTPIQFMASIPNKLGRYLTASLEYTPDLQIAYDNLHNEYFKVKSETLLLRTLENENKNLRSLLDASQRLKEKITLAELINVSIDPYNHRILVGRGGSNGVYAGQAVIDDQGVIGQVTEVMPFNSSVMLITDPSHAMPVQVERNGLRTVVYGAGNTSHLKIPFLNQNSDIIVGDLLLSSGLGGRFPNGYPVAEISKVETLADEAFIRVSAKPIAKLDRSNHVLLLSREQRSYGSDTSTRQNNE